MQTNRLYLSLIMINISFSPRLIDAAEHQIMRTFNTVYGLLAEISGNQNYDTQTFQTECLKKTGTLALCSAAYVASPCKKAQITTIISLGLYASYQVYLTIEDDHETFLAERRPAIQNETNSQAGRQALDTPHFRNLVALNSLADLHFIALSNQTYNQIERDYQIRAARMDATKCIGKAASIIAGIMTGITLTNWLTS